jgi:hypothetical protein
MLDYYAGDVAYNGFGHSGIGINKLGRAERTKAFTHFKQGCVSSNSRAEWGQYRFEIGGHLHSYLPTIGIS